MPKQPNIRVTTQDREQLRKLNKRVLNKKSRVRRKHGYELEEIQTTSINDFTTRKQFNKYREQMESFLNRSNLSYQFETNKHGETYNKREIREIERKIKRVNKQKAEEERKYKKEFTTLRGESIGITVGEKRGFFNEERFDLFNKINFNLDRFRSRREFEQYKEKINNNYSGDWITERHENYKENYLQALENQLGGMGDHIQEHVENMPINEFIKLYYTEELANIRFVYDEIQKADTVTELEGVFGIEA